MTRFRDLVKPDLDGSPGEEQKRASAGLAGAVRDSGLRWKGDPGPWHDEERCLLLAVAPYSRYDLGLLDIIEEELSSKHPAVHVYIANLLDYDSLARLGEDFPESGMLINRR